MTLFYVGTHNVKLDDKGRFFVPAPWRARLLENAMLVFRGDHLGLFDEETFAEFVEKISAFVEQKILPRSDLNTIFELSDVATVDSQGRLVIPKKLRDAVGLAQGPITLAGRRDHFAIMPGATDDDEAADIYEAARPSLARLTDLGL